MSDALQKTAHADFRTAPRDSGRPAPIFQRAFFLLLSGFCE